MMPPAPTPGGAQPNYLSIYQPPIAVHWMLTGLIVFAGAVANRIPQNIRTLFTSPIGFFLTGVTAIAVFQTGFIPAAFAILFFLLMNWQTEMSIKSEGFINASNTVDWVTNSKRWYVEKVLREQPIAIQEKDVSTYPVQGASAQSGTSNGNT